MILTSPKQLAVAALLLPALVSSFMAPVPRRAGGESSTVESRSRGGHMLGCGAQRMRMMAGESSESKSQVD